MSGIGPEAYDVEARLFSVKGRYGRLRRVPGGVTLADQRAIAHRVAAEAFGLEPLPTVERRRGNPHTFESWADPKANRIVLGACAGPLVICHEVAHLAAPAKRQGAATWHGPEWQDCFVLAVRVELGDVHADRLDRAFTAMRARHHRNRSRAASRSARSR